MVRFAEQVQTRKIPKVEIELIPELFYSKFDFRRFKSEEQFREERAVARAIRRLVGNAITEMDVRLHSCDDVQNMERQLLLQQQQQQQQQEQQQQSILAHDTAMGRTPTTNYETNATSAAAVVVSSDEESDEDDMRKYVKPLAIREERIKARRRSSLLAMPSYKPHAFEDENVGLMHPSPRSPRDGKTHRRRPKTSTKESSASAPVKNHSFGDNSSALAIEKQRDFALEQPLADIHDVLGSGMDLDDLTCGAVDLTFTPVEFETVIDETSGRPSYLQHNTKQ